MPRVVVAVGRDAAGSCAVDNFVGVALSAGGGKEDYRIGWEGCVRGVIAFDIQSRYTPSMRRLSSSSLRLVRSVVFFAFLGDSVAVGEGEGREATVVPQRLEAGIGVRLANRR